MPPTFFAPSDRATAEQITKAKELLAGEPRILTLLEAIPLPAALLNPQRQMLISNVTLIGLLGRTQGVEVNQRLGEALGCVHVLKDPLGCGSGVACSSCGLGVAIFGSQLMDSAVKRECHFEATNDYDNHFDFEVIASPLELGGQTFTLVLLRDISEIRRRSAMERLFLHDLLNTASGLHVLSRLLETEAITGVEREECKVSFSYLSENLIDDITHQRKLVQAERGELILEVETIPVRTFLESLITVCNVTLVGRDRSLRLGSVWEGSVDTDGVLLRRVLINLIKNGLEATRTGGTVTITCTAMDDDVEFQIHNPGFIERSSQAQIFRRTFSTKSGGGRGLGAYSVKLFVESYMRGTVRFCTDMQEGTVFSFRIPKVFSLSSRGLKTYQECV